LILGIGGYGKVVKGNKIYKYKQKGKKDKYILGE